MPGSIADFFNGLIGNQPDDDDTQNTINTGIGTYTRAPATPSMAGQIGGFLNKTVNFLGDQAAGYAANDPYMHHGEGGGGGERQSTRDLLQQRLGLNKQQAAQKQADWEQTFNAKQSLQRQTEQDTAQKIAESKAREQDVQEQRRFQQATTGMKMFNSGEATVAPQAAPEDVQVIRGGHSADPEDIGQVSTVHLNPTFADTQGRPSVEAGGVTMIPRSPEEAADAAQQAKQAEFNARLADVVKTNPQFVKDHQNDISAYQLFGKAPSDRVEGNLIDGLTRTAVTDPDPAKRAAAEAAVKKAVNLKKGGEDIPDINMRNPKLQPWELDQSALEGESNQIKAKVQLLVDRKASIGSFSMKDPDWKRAISIASQVDPSFSLANYGIQQKTKGDYAAGFRSRQSQSFRTVIDHMSALEDASKSLNNFNTQWENSAYQTARPKLPGGYPELDAAKTAVGAVGAEMANTVKGGNAAATDPEINNWLKNYDLTKPPAGLHKTNQEGVQLMLDRAAASQNNWEDTMGRPMDAPIFTRYYADQIDKIMGSPEFTQRYMNVHSRFGENNTSVDSKGSITGPNTVPSTSAPTGVTFRDKATGKTDTTSDPVKIAKRRASKELEEVK